MPKKQKLIKFHSQNCMFNHLCTNYIIANVCPCHKSCLHNSSLYFSFLTNETIYMEGKWHKHNNKGWRKLMQMCWMSRKGVQHVNYTRGQFLSHFDLSAHSFDHIHISCELKRVEMDIRQIFYVNEGRHRGVTLIKIYGKWIDRRIIFIIFKVNFMMSWG